MDLDMTEAITFSDAEEDSQKIKLPVAHLTILNHQTMKGKSFPIFRGKNIIGRQEHSCEIYIPVKSLSKKHACIEVRGHSHLLYDMSSLNKSRRGTLFLTPEVRYELKDKDTLVFADISCKYTVEEIARASDSGSDTEAMSDMEVELEDVSSRIPAASKSNISLDLEQSNSSSSGSDILLPTQDFPINNFAQGSNAGFQNISPVKGEVLAIDSSPENDAESTYRNDRYFQNNANNEANHNSDILAAATQAYVADSDDEAASEEYDDTENPIFVADTQPQTPSSNNSIPEYLQTESDKLQLNSPPSSQSPTVSIAEGSKTKTSPEKPINNKPEEKLDDALFCMSTYKDDIERTNTELDPVNKSPETEPFTSTAYETLAESFQKLDKSKNENISTSSVPDNKTPGSKSSATITKSTVSSPIKDTIPLGTIQELPIPADKMNTSTPVKDTVPLMDTVEVMEETKSEKQSQVAESLKTVPIETVSDTVCVQVDETEAISPTKGQTAIINPDLSTPVSSPKVVCNTDYNENDRLDATQPYILESSFSSPKTKQLLPSTPRSNIDDKTQPLRQSCGLDVETAGGSCSASKGNTPVKNNQTKSPAQTPKRSRAHSVSSDEESIAGTDEPIFKDKPVLENLTSDKSNNIEQSISSTINTMSGDLFNSGKSSLQATPSTAPCASNVTEAKGSGEPNTVELESLDAAVIEQADLETRASKQPNVTTTVSPSRDTDEKLAVEIPDNAEVSCEIEEDIVKRSKKLKEVEVPTPTSEKNTRPSRSNRKTVKPTDTSESVEVPEMMGREKRSMNNRTETNIGSKSKVRKSIRFDLPEEEESSEEEKYSSKSSKKTKKTSNRFKKSSTASKGKKSNTKLSACSYSNLVDVMTEKYSKDSKTELKSNIGRGKRIKIEKNVSENEMEIDDDFVGKNCSEIGVTADGAIENISIKVEEENVALSQNRDDSRKSGRSLKGKSKKNNEKIQENLSNTSTTSTSQHPVSEDLNKDTPRSCSVSRSKRVKIKKESCDETTLETVSNNTTTSRSRSTRGTKKEVVEDKEKSKKASKISLKKTSNSKQQCEEPCQENSSEERKNINQEENMEMDEASDSKVESNIEENATEDTRSSQHETQKNKRKISKEEASSKISEKHPKRKKIFSEKETESSEKDSVKNLSQSSDTTTDSTASKTTSTKRGQSKRQLCHLQDTKNETHEMQELKTPSKRRENHRSDSQSSNESSSTATPKNLTPNQFISPRRNNGQSKPNVMFTGLTDDSGQRIVKQLGGSVVTDYDCCTHLITDKVRRTVKFLCCLARGIPIISLHWLTKCRSAKTFIDYTPYILSDSDTEKQYNFSLSQSLQLARSSSPLKGYKIHVTKSVKPNAEHMKEIIESCKAKFLMKLPSDYKENTVVISCEEDQSSCKKTIEAGIPIVEAEFLLTGILQQDLSINKYQIFQTPSTNETSKQPDVRKSKSTRKTMK